MPAFYPGAFPPSRHRVWAPGYSWNVGDICVVYYIEHGRQMVASFQCTAPREFISTHDRLAAY